MKLSELLILKAYGTGTVRIKTRFGSKVHNCTLSEALFVPMWAVNLFPVHAADSKGNKIQEAKIYSPVERQQEVKI